MKILVAVKRVVDAKIKVRPLPDHSGVDVKLAKMAMNPFDEIAIEKAVTLREAGVADEVVAVTVGPLKAVDTLRVAMAIGADRAVHVRTDESLEPLAVAKVLRAVVEREKPDLVLLGKQAIDDDANQTGQMLSALCDMPLATFANEIVLGADQIGSLAFTLVAPLSTDKNNSRHDAPPHSHDSAGNRLPYTLYPAKFRLTQGEAGGATTRNG